MHRDACSTLRLLVLTVIPALLLAGSFRADSKAPGQPGKTVKPFTLKDSAGKAWSLADAQGKKAVVVVFLGTECPINNQYLPRLAELHKSYSDRVAFVGINSNVHDTPARIAGHVKANGIPFPVLKDSANVVADDFGARRTPEAFVLSPAGKVLYQGRIDDQIGIGYKRKQPSRRDLVEAIEEVLAGKEVSKPTTEVAGCIIARAVKPKETGTITWAKDVSRIFQERCQECHRPGQVGPMPLMSYEDALSWSEMIREVVEEKRMPPWHADPRHGKFLNDRSLTAQQREAILGWTKQGCPKGDLAELPAAKKWETGWGIGKPDMVFEMPTEFTVPAEGGERGIAYKYFVVPTNFKEDRWVQAAEARPGSREVVHHIIVYVFDKSRMGKRLGGRAQRTTGTSPGDGIGDGFLVAYAPGDMPLRLEPGQAKKVPRGSMIVFQMHYTPDGVERKDRSSVGLIFAKQPPKYEVRTRSIAQRRISIPAGDANYEAVSVSKFDRDADLLSLMPHMHLRGKDFKYVVVFPDGKKETLLSVPKYDFNWQSSYRLAKPLRLPAGTRIECTAHFDNSADNPNNPDPKKRVSWGDQTWQEMMIGFVDYAFVGEKKPVKDEKSDRK
jgi:peroxiredoxin